MHRALQEHLACPSCRTGYALHIHECAGEEVLWGFLRCPSCAIVIPIAEGFAFFTEPLLHEGQASRAALETRAGVWFGTEEEYLTYRARKMARGEMEPYAAFHPFNESTRAFDAVAAVLEADLKPGEAILDPWSRTGWSAEALAARFPAQRVVALWEGDRSVLGYRGYLHWLSHRQRAPNLDVLFVHPERGLPFRNESFAALYALDSFHRFSLHGFAGELLRVTGKQAPLVLSHLHLTNSEPEPWFDRGCTMHHGRDYRAWLDALGTRGDRKTFVWSEIDLFEASDGPLPPDSPDTSHYNGFILIAPDTKRAKTFSARETRFLVNPLFRLHLGRKSARIERGLYDGIAGEMLDRHPVYHKRLPKDAVALSERALALLALAVTGRTLDDCTAALGDVAALVQELTATELLLPVPVSEGAFDLQRFHANQMPLASGAALVTEFLSAIGREEGDVFRTSDGESLGAGEAREILARTITVLRARDLGPGKSLGVAALDHPLGWLAALAGLALGADISLLPPQSGGAFDLLIRGEGEAPNVLALGLDGAAGSLLAALESAEPAALAAVSGATFTCLLDGHALSVDAAGLVEAALSLSGAAARHPLSLDVPWGFGALLAALVALWQRQPLSLGRVASSP